MEIKRNEITLLKKHQKMLREDFKKLNQIRCYALKEATRFKFRKRIIKPAKALRLAMANLICTKKIACAYPWHST